MDVQSKSALRPSNRYETKGEAMARGKELAKKQPLGQIVIQKKDGTFQTEYTYGKDPYPPKG